MTVAGDCAGYPGPMNSRERTWTRNITFDLFSLAPVLVMVDTCFRSWSWSQSNFLGPGFCPFRLVSVIVHDPVLRSLSSIGNEYNEYNTIFIKNLLINVHHIMCPLCPPHLKSEIWHDPHDQPVIKLSFEAHAALF